MRLMYDVRRAIICNRFPAFIRDFMKTRFGKTAPLWIVDSLKSVNVDLTVPDETGYSVTPVEDDFQKEPNW
ncbi:hypothetical protein EV177_010060 [Coemansia sp. RSA 1804]|nr:hypothetical protein EV177_010060 [Coemansia sp. RSA 1804]